MFAITRNAQVRFYIYAIHISYILFGIILIEFRSIARRLAYQMCIAFYGRAAARLEENVIREQTRETNASTSFIVCTCLLSG